MTNDKKDIPVIFDLSEDLRFLHGDTRMFTRNEALRAIAMKLLLLREPHVIEVYLESVITLQGDQYFLLDAKEAEKSVKVFFHDLCTTILQVPKYICEWKEVRIQIISTVRKYFNAASFCADNRYILTTHNKELNDRVERWINIVSGKPTEELLNFGSGKDIKFSMVKALTGLEDNRTIKKYLENMGLAWKVKGGKNYLSEEFLQKLMAYSENRQSA